MFDRKARIMYIIYGVYHGCHQGVPPSTSLDASGKLLFLWALQIRSLAFRPSCSQRHAMAATAGELVELVAGRCRQPASCRIQRIPACTGIPVVSVAILKRLEAEYLPPLTSLSEPELCAVAPRSIFINKGDFNCRCFACDLSLIHNPLK